MRSISRLSPRYRRLASVLGPDNLKIRVQHENGQIEVVAVVGACQVIQGVELDRLVSAEGTEHFFTKDGYNDGLGRSLPQLDQEHADSIIGAIERERVRPESA